jgi:hypothetical protein
MNIDELRLGLDSPLVKPGAPNVRVPSWPPPPDFPLVIDADGEVVSRYGDTTWDLWPWANQVMSLRFTGGRRSKKSPVLTEADIEL